MTIIDEGGEPSRRPLFRASVETREVYNLLKAAKEGDVVTYAALSSAIGGADVRATGVLASARRMLMRDENKVFDPEPNHGLRLLSDTEVTASGERYTQKVSRAARRERQRLNTVKYADLSQEDQIKYNTQMSVISIHELFASSKAQKRIAAECSSAVLNIGRTLELFQS
jgi:hypothetical protein